MRKAILAFAILFILGAAIPQAAKSLSLMPEEPNDCYIKSGDTWLYTYRNLGVREASGVDIDNSDWWVGKAPFGNEPIGDFVPKTDWPEGTILWVRKTIYLPASTDLKAYIAIDNSFELYWNGAIAGLGNKDGAAERWSSIFTIPASVVRPGKNVIAFRLTDRGFTSTFDMMLEPVCTQTQTVENQFRGHYYAAVSAPKGITWNHAKEMAETMSYAGIPGHLATITSADENAFIKENFPNIPTSWIGGYQPAGSPEPAGNWKWVTSEPWDYSNWAAGEPNNTAGMEDAIEWRGPQGWNDGTSSVSQPGYIVEFISPEMLR